MNAGDWVNLFRLIPSGRHGKLMLVLKTGSEISLDSFVRFEPDYMVVRGRVAGTSDEGRAFFVPFDQLQYVRVEDVVKVTELAEMYGQEVTFDDNGKPVLAAFGEPEPAEEPAKPGRSSGARAVTARATPANGKTVDSLLRRINDSSGKAGRRG